MADTPRTGDSPGSSTSSERSKVSPEMRQRLDVIRAQREARQAADDDRPRPGDERFDPGEHHGELRGDFRAGVHDPEGRFSTKERRIADRLEDDGASVHPRKRDDTVEGKKNPDAMVRWSPDDPGTVTEFKTLDQANSNTVRRTLLEAGAQVKPHGGGNAVIDGRDAGLSEADARRGYARAVGQARDTKQPMPDQVKIILGNGTIIDFPED